TASADVREVRRTQREEPAVGGERELDLGDEVASLVVGDERLPAGRGEFHWPAELARRPEREPVLDVDAVLRAEVTADVRGADASLVRLDAEHGGEVALLAHRAARAGVKRVAAARGVVRAERGARLDRDRGAASDVELHADDAIRVRERARGP